MIGVTSEKKNMLGENVTLFFNSEKFLSLMSKIESNSITKDEHNYFQKIIVAQELINKICRREYIKSNDFSTYKNVIKRYYLYLLYNLKNHRHSIKEEVDFFLISKLVFNSPFLDIKDQTDKKPFLFLKELAEKSNFYLKNEKSSIINFFKYFLIHFYEIPEYIVIQILDLLRKDWKPKKRILRPIIDDSLSYEEIETYFFGKKKPNHIQVIVNDALDRYFSIPDPNFDNFLFLPKKENFNFMESALIVHELQHIADEINSSTKKHYSSYESEKSSLQAEKIFLSAFGFFKREKYSWLESNLFYPLIFLELELSVYCQEACDSDTFSKICQKHEIAPIPFSPLYFEGAPFQMATYCAACIELEINWKSYLITEENFLYDSD